VVIIINKIQLLDFYNLIIYCLTRDCFFVRENHINDEGEESMPRTRTRKMSEHDVLWALLNGTIDPSLISPENWLEIIRLSLRCCKPVLRKMAERKRESRSFVDVLNRGISSSNSSGRRTPKDIIKNVPEAFFTNNQWLFIPVVDLEKCEKEGLFSETKLFILVDMGFLVIIDTEFRKVSAGLSEGTFFNEVVESCCIAVDHKYPEIDSEKEFREMILPFLADKELKLGEQIIHYTLDGAVDALREIKSETKIVEESMMPFLKIRERLGISNCL